MAEKQEALATQKFVEISRTKNGTAVLKDGGLRRILMVSAVNFDLKSEEEQNLIINSFQNFLNSLNFSIQIVVHSRKINIEGYLEALKALQERETNELLRNQIYEYGEFIRSFVNENAIMNKTYYVVVPFDPVKVPITGKSASGGVLGFLKKPSPNDAQAATALSERELDEHIQQLEQRVNQVVSGLHPLELRAVPLNDEEIIELFYNLYNPGEVEKRELGIAREAQKEEEAPTPHA